MDGIWLADSLALSQWIARRGLLASSAQTRDDFANWARAQEELRPMMIGDVAVVKVHGLIEYRASVWGWLMGGVSTMGLARLFRSLGDDAAVARVVVDFDSPGGDYIGTPEAAAALRELSNKKPVDAIVNPYAASAATWLATAAQRIAVIRSGFIGSIGTYTEAVSIVRALEAIGYDVEVIRSPEWKAEGHPALPITEERRAFLQARVDAITDEFVKAVAKFRDVTYAKVRSDYGQGRMLSASEALNAGLVDSIVKSADDVLTSGRRGSSARSKPRTAGKQRQRKRPLSGENEA